MEEIWKAIPGETLYEASNLGRIRCVARANTSPRKGNNPYVLKLFQNKGGLLCFEYRKKGMRSVGRAVLSAFDRRPKKNETCHFKDGNRLNCHLSNLKWITKSEHGKMYYDRADKRIGSPKPGITRDIFYQIRATKGVRTQQSWADELGCARQTIQKIQNTNHSYEDRLKRGRSKF